MKSTFIKAVLIVFFISPIILKAQTSEKVIKVTGDIITPLTITKQDLQAYKQTTVNRKDKEGKNHIYTGVLLNDILQNAGATLGENLKGINLTKYVLAEAVDGYKALFALTELDKAFTGRSIIITTNVDGKPLPANEGPFRIIVQDEKKPARCVRQLISLKVVLPK